MKRDMSEWDTRNKNRLIIMVKNFNSILMNLTIIQWDNQSKVIAKNLFQIKNESKRTQNK